MEQGKDSEFGPSRLPENSSSNRESVPKEVGLPVVEDKKREEEKLAGLRGELQRRSGSDEREQKLLPVGLMGEEKPKGFWQSPLKVVKNAVWYPTWEAGTVVVLGSLTTIPVATAVAVLGAPEVGMAAYLGALGLTGYELVRNFVRERKVGNFFRVMKVKPNSEKALKDGTRVTLDDFVGELHMSGLTRLWRLAFMKDKMKRALIVSEGVLQGLVNLGEKVQQSDPWYRDFKAFKGTSWIVNPRIAERFGFEVGGSESGWFFSVFLRKVDKTASFAPEMAPMAEIRTAWISREKLLEVYESGVIQNELAKVKRALARRTS